MAADFEQPCIALAVVQIPFQGRGHGHDPGGLEHAGFFREWIGQPRRRDSRRPEKRVALLGDVRNSHNFPIPQANETLAQTSFGFTLRQARRSLPCRRQARRKFVEAVDACDFLDQIDFAFDFGAPRRLRALPRREERAFRAAVVVDANRSKAERAQAGFNLLIGNVRTHDAQNFRTRHADLLRRAFAGINIDDSCEKLASSKFENQFGRAPRSQFGHFRIGAAAEAQGRFGVQFQRTAGTSNGHGVKPGAFDQYIFCGKRNFRFGAAHDPADAKRTRAVAVGNHAHAGIELTLDAVKSADLFFGLGRANHDLVVANLVVVESMKRVAQLEHHVVGDIHDVADARDARSFKADLEPFGRGLYLEVAYDARGVEHARVRWQIIYVDGLAIID